MNQLEPHQYHLSNFHRELMEAKSPEIARGYDFLQQQRREAEDAAVEAQRALRDYIRVHKLKAVKKPEVVARAQARKAAQALKPTPTQLEQLSLLEEDDRQRSADRIKRMIAAMNSDQ